MGLTGRRADGQTPTPTPAPTPTPTPAGPASRPITLTSVTTAVRPGATAVIVSLRSSKNCTGTLSLQTANTEASSAARTRRRAHRIALGTAHFRLRAGHRTAVVVRLSRAGRHLLLRAHTLKALLTVRLTSGRARTTTHRTVTLRAPRARRRHR